MSTSTYFDSGKTIAVLMLSLASSILPMTTAALFVPFPTFNILRIRESPTVLQAKKKNRRQGMGNMNSWYDDVDSSASPDDVFWEETERQRLLNQIGNERQQFDLPIDEAGRDVATTASSLQSFQNTPLSLDQQISQQANERNIEATLQQYSAFRVSDNWLDDDLLIRMETSEEPVEQLTKEEQDAYLEQKVKEMDNDDPEAQENGNNGPAPKFDFTEAWNSVAEPWDLWGQSSKDQGDEAIRFEPNPDSEYYDEMEDEEDAKIEEELLLRLSKMKFISERLEKARSSPKAAAFFQREPDALEGYDNMWVSAIDNVCFKNLVGVFRNYGVQFADNFGDFESDHTEDQFVSLEDVASFKARKVYEVTGLPTIASQSGFEIEPIPPSELAVPGQKTSNNPLIKSGYKFNSIGDFVDHIIEALKPVSDPSRVTQFKTCLCFYDGEVELYEYGVCDVDIYFAKSMRTFLPISVAINGICKVLQMTFGLEYMKWLKAPMTESTYGITNAVAQLRDRVLKDGRVLPNDIVDVSSFMDSMVDINLMDDCAKELSNRFVDLRPTKILTVATTGLVIALPMAKYLQVPVVYARKERNVVMADTFKAGYSSKTVGKDRELLVSKNHLDEEDRVLVIDDFLSSGASQEALLRIICEAEAEAVGVGVLLEKVYDSGRQSLSGFNIPVESLCKIVSVQHGVIQLQEEEGYDKQ